MNARGIDISKWQVATPDLTGRAFVFVRATYGTAEDSRFNKHARNVLAAGKVLGAYHFGVGDSTAGEQAKAFLSVVGDKPTLLVLDLERNAGGKDMADAKAENFIAAVKRLDPLKRKVGLYHSESGWPGNLGQDFNWIAKWGSEPPTRGWRFWQYRGSPLDLDEFHGTRAQLKAFAALPPQPEPPPELVEPSDPPTPIYTQDQLESAVGEAQDALRAEIEALEARISQAVQILAPNVTFQTDEPDTTTEAQG